LSHHQLILGDSVEDSVLLGKVAPELSLGVSR
jgi:hypothetical protein